MNFPAGSPSFAILLTIATNAVYTSYPRVIAIEEPENHLHPAFQSLLADMFYEAHKEFNLSFIIANSLTLINSFFAISRLFYVFFRTAYSAKLLLTFFV